MDALSPEQIEQRIRETSNRIAKSAEVCNERYKTFLRANHDYEQAYAAAYMGHEGPAHERRYAATLATADEHERLIVSDAAYKYADRLAKALESELRAWQSVGASIRSMYAVAGRGEY